MRRTIIRILYILMGVQIAFGCAYFVAAFLEEQRFEENIVFFLPSGVIYLIQLVSAAFSTWYFLGKTGIRERRTKGCLCAFLLTVPFLLQMHMARLVWSLSLSAFLWLLGLVLDMRDKELSAKKGLVLCGVYSLYGIVCPDGLWLGGILLLAAVLFYGGNRKREKISSKASPEVCAKEPGKAGFCLAVFLTAGILFLVNLGLNAALPDQRRVYRENNLGTAAVSRLVWPNFATNYFFWSEEVKAVLSEEEAIDVSERIDLLEKEFYPAMRETYGAGRATALCLEMGYRCLMDRSRETVLEIAADFRDYLLIPFTIERNLQGEGASLTAWNYGRMRECEPLLVKYYYRYGLLELPLLLLGSLLLWISRENGGAGRLKGEKADGKRRRGVSPGGKLLICTAVLYTLWYTMKSNLPVDYKQVLPVLLVWYLAAGWGITMERPDGRDEEDHVKRQKDN